MALIWNFLFIYLISYILTEKNRNDNRKLQSIQRVDIIIEVYDIRAKVANVRYYPNRVLINGTNGYVDRYGLINIYQYGIYNITLEWDRKIEDYSYLFENIDKAIEINFVNFDLSNVKSLSGMFSNCNNLRKINFNNFNTSSVEDMSLMFQNCYQLTSLDLSSFDTRNVINMEKMFYYCCSLMKTLNLSSLITPKLKTINYMFYGLYNIESLDLSNMDTSSVLYMNFTFSGCSSLKYLDISSFDTQNVISMVGMFSYSGQLESLDLSHFYTPNLKFTTKMFSGCSSLKNLNISNLNTSHVENMDGMFESCSSLVSLDLSNFETSEVISMTEMFSYCGSLTFLDLSSFDFSQKNMNYLFRYCTSLTSIIFSKEYQLVTKIESMFYGCSSLISIDFSNFDFGFCDSFYYLFYGCSSLISLDLSDIDVLSVTNMQMTFGNCYSLKILLISNWATSSLQDIYYTFSHCSSLTSLNINDLDTSLVSNMQGTFYNCHSLLSLDLSNFNTSSTMYMGSMFFNCTSLTSLDVSNFNTSSLSDAYFMFNGCSNLTVLNLSNFSLEKIGFLYGMFVGCSSIEYINIYNFSIGNSFFVQMYYGVMDNIVVCINEDGNNLMTSLNEIKLKKCPLIDCSENWRDHKSRLIEKKNMCIDKCYNDDTYKYEFKFHCYEKCPKGTYPLKDNLYICESKLNECFSEFPFINLIDNTCLEECNSENFFNNICTINNITDYTKTQNILIKTIINEIQDGSLDQLLKDVLKDQKDVIKLEKYTLYQITSSFNQINNEYQNFSSINLGDCEKILKEKNNITEDENLIIFKLEQYIDGILIPLIQYEIFNPNSKEKLDLSYCTNEGKNIYLNIPISFNENILMKYDPNNDYYKDMCTTYTTEFGTDINLYDRINEFNDYYSICPKNCIYKGYNLNKNQAICNCTIKEGIFIKSHYTKNELIYLLKLKHSRNVDMFKCYKLLFSIKRLIKNIGNYIIAFIIIIFIILAITFYLKEYNSICDQINDLLRAKFVEIYYDTNKDEVKENSTDIISSSKKSKNSDIKNNSEKYIIDKKSDTELSVNDNVFNDEIQNKKKIKTIDISDYEINNFSYKEAFGNDKRTFFQFYISLLKSNHILIFTFNKKNDYNSYIIKICLLLFYLTLNLILNSLFFNEQALHKIYIDKGNFNFKYVLPQIMYSIIICHLLFPFLRRISLTEQNILQIKHEKNKMNFSVKASAELKYINVKFKAFFVICLIFLILFWYYLSSFCVVYKNTQIYLIKTTLISYLISFIIPLIIYSFIGFLRIFSLKNPEKCIYKISQFIQIY